MEYSKFENILETLDSRCQLEDELYSLGVDISALKYDMLPFIMDLFDEIYPESKGDVEWFCWEKDFGRNYEARDAVDEYGRDLELYSIRDLHNVLESRKNVDNIYGEPYEEEGILATGRYKGVEYTVSYSGVAPCAYINMYGMKTELVDKVDKECWRGVTWRDDYIPFAEKRDKVFAIGWDYYLAKQKKTEEIVAEIKRIIDKLPDKI